MDKIAVIGDYDSIYGFSALGLDIYPCDEESVHDELIHLAGGEYGIIYITEKLAAKVPGVIDHYKNAVSPAIIPIPGASGNSGMGIRNIKKSVEQAVGADILFADEKG